MTLIHFLKLILRYYKMIVAVPLVLALLVIFVTKKEKKEFSSEMSIYTGIASGYTIQSLENYRVDMFNTNNQFDNLINVLKSRETKEEVALKLLAMHLVLKNPEKEKILKPAYIELHTHIPEDVKPLIITGSEEKTYNQLVKFKDANNQNFIYKLLNSNHKYYSINTLSRASIKRMGNSDLVQIDYYSDDPAICFQSLKLLSEVFIKNYKLLKQVQTDAIVKYFEQQLAAVASKLKVAEDKLLEFNQTNRIINYYEQTRYIAEQKEYLETEYLREKMNFSASEAATKTLEAKIGDREKIFWKNDAIIRLRNELHNLTMKMVEVQSATESQKNILPGKTQLQLKIDSVKTVLQNEISDVIKISNTKEGIETEKIVSQWLNSMIANEESRAKLEVYDQRREEFKKIYAEMAPLGATIKRIEREIDINEKEYLSVLHGLNMAKLKMQDIEMSSNLKITDPPYYPVNPEPSKRKLIVILAFIGGILLMFTTVFFLEYTDKTIRTPENAEKLTGLKVIGLYPRIQKKIQWTTELAKKLSMILARLLADHRQNPSTKICVFSTTDTEGKSTIINEIINDLNSLGYKSIKQELIPDDYKNPNKIFERISESTEDFVFTEIPSIIYTPAPASVINKFDLFVLICRANREWRPADTHALKIFKNTSGKKPYLILNGIDPDAVETFIGEVPKKRSKIRVWFKKLLTMRFQYKNSI